MNSSSKVFKNSNDFYSDKRASSSNNQESTSNAKTSNKEFTTNVKVRNPIVPAYQKSSQSNTNSSTKKVLYYKYQVKDGEKIVRYNAETEQKITRSLAYDGKNPSVKTNKVNSVSGTNNDADDSSFVVQSIKKDSSSTDRKIISRMYHSNLESNNQNTMYQAGEFSSKNYLKEESQENFEKQ